MRLASHTNTHLKTQTRLPHSDKQPDICTQFLGLGTSPIIIPKSSVPPTQKDDRLLRKELHTNTHLHTFQ